MTEHKAQRICILLF